MIDWVFFLLTLPVEILFFWGPYIFIRFIFKSYQEHKAIQFLQSNRGLALMLAAFPIIGFFFQLEYNTQSGCFVTHPPIFQFNNLLWSGIPLLVYSFLTILPKPRLILLLTTLETLLWIFKVLFISQGFAVGFASLGDPFFMTYIAVVLSLRLFLLRAALGVKWRWYWIAAIVFLFIVFWGNFWGWIYGDLFLW